MIRLCKSSLFARLFWACLIFNAFFVFNACTPKEAIVPQDQTIEDNSLRGFLSHKVTYQGENLGIISQWYTGKTTNWKAIQNANPRLNPQKIRIGDVILIPRELVVQSKPLASDFIRKNRSSASTPTSVVTNSVPSVVNNPITLTDEIKEPVKDSSQKVAEPSINELLSGAEKSVKNGPTEEVSKPTTLDDNERDKLLDELLQN